MSTLSGYSPEIESALQDCLDAISEGRHTLDECLAKYPAYADQIAPTLIVAASLRKARQVRPSLGFRKQAKSRMQQRISESARKHVVRKEYSLQPKAAPVVFPRFAFRMLSMLGIVTLIAGMTGFTAQAADRAAPGDPLFGADLIVERVSLSFAGSPETQVALQLAIADERLLEAEALVNEGAADRAASALALYDRTVDDLWAAVNRVDEAHRQAAHDRVSKNLNANITQMTALLDRVPAEDRAGIEIHIQKTRDQANQHSQHGMHTIQNGDGGSSDGGGEDATDEPSETDNTENDNAAP